MPQAFLKFKPGGHFEIPVWARARRSYDLSMSKRFRVCSLDQESLFLLRCKTRWYQDEGQRHRSVDYQKISEREQHWRSEVERVLHQAQQTGQEEEQRFGRHPVNRIHQFLPWNLASELSNHLEVSQMSTQNRLDT
jgi:hypothetical protein